MSDAHAREPPKPDPADRHPPDGNPPDLPACVRELAAVRHQLSTLQATVRRNEETVRSLVGRLHDGVVIVGSDGRIRLWNPGMEAVSGIAAKDAVGELIWDVQYRQAVAEKRDTGLFEDIQRTTRKILAMEDVRGFGAPLQNEIERPDGSRRWIEAILFPIAMEGGIAIGSIIRDITAEYEAEQQVAGIARLVAEAPSPVLRAASDGRLIYSNPASAPLLQKWGCSVGKLLPGEWADRVRQALGSGAPSIREVTIDGRIYAFMLAPVLSRGEVDVYGMDITRRRQAEDALQLSEERFRHVFEQAPIGVALVEQSGAIIEVNRAMADLTGYSREQLRALDWRDLVHPEDVGAERHLLERVIAGALGAYRVEERLVRADGAVLWAIVNAALLRTSAAEPVYLVVQVQDITERRLAEELSRRVAMAARVEEAEERERRRVAQELHDRVGQELSALSISLGLLRRQGKGRLTGDTEARLNDALSLVDQITASVRNAMAELHPPQLEERGLLAALRWYAGLFEKRTNLAVQVKGHEPTPRLPSLTATMLFRIVQEALSNVARHAWATRVEIRVDQRADHVRLTVRDNGRGFDPEGVVDRTATHGWGLRTMAEKGGIDWSAFSY